MRLVESLKSMSILALSKITELLFMLKAGIKACLAILQSIKKLMKIPKGRMKKSSASLKDTKTTYQKLQKN